MKKRTIIFAFALALLLLTSIGASALMRWLYVSTFDTSLNFSGTTANCGTVITAHSNSATITATARLIRINANGSETTIRTWGNLSGTGRLIFSDTQAVTRGFTYRLEVDATVSTPQGSESISGSSTARCP